MGQEFGQPPSRTVKWSVRQSVGNTARKSVSQSYGWSAGQQVGQLCNYQIYPSIRRLTACHDLTNSKIITFSSYSLSMNQS